jgi:hypothetical protein
MVWCNDAAHVGGCPAGEPIISDEGRVLSEACSSEELATFREVLEKHPKYQYTQTLVRDNGPRGEPIPPGAITAQLLLRAAVASEKLQAFNCPHVSP